MTEDAISGLGGLTVEEFERVLKLLHNGAAHNGHSRTKGMTSDYRRWETKTAVGAVQLAYVKVSRPAPNVHERHHFEVRGERWAIHFRAAVAPLDGVASIRLPLPSEGVRSVFNLKLVGDLDSFERDMVLVKMFAEC